MTDSMERAQRNSANANPEHGLIRKLFFSPLSTCSSLLQEFQSHSHRLRMCTRTTANLRWPTVFGTSPWFDKKSPALLIIRATLALIFVGHFIANLVDAWSAGYYFIYLTHWSFMMETAYFCFATYTAFAARKMLAVDGVGGPSGESEGVRLPWFVSTTWALQHVAMPAALLVFVLYWLLDNPIYDLKYTPGYLGFFVHGINFLLMLVDLFVGRNVFYLKHTLFFFVYAGAFFIWSAVHYAANIGTYKECDKYPRSECPIYDVIDWHKASATAILLSIILFCVVPFCQYPLWWCVYKRRVVDDYVQHSDTTASTPTTDPAVAIGASQL